MAEAKARIGVGTILAGLAVVAGAVLLAWPAPEDMAPEMLRAAGAVVIAVCLWATGVVPPFYTSIVFMFLAIAIGIAPANVVFSGFHSGAVWLVFGGLILGVAVQKSGLGERAVRLMLRHFPVSYAGIVWAIVVVGAVLAFFIPSAMGRVLLLLPIVFALAERLGFPEGSRGRTGMVLAAALGTMVPAFSLLPSNVPNMGLIGAAESIYGVHFTYGEYFLLNYPVMAGLTLLFLPLWITARFKDTPKAREIEAAGGGWSRDERRLMLILAAALALWVTDFLHHISPAWVAMGAAVLILLPRLGVLAPGAMSKDVEYGPWLFVAGVIGLGAVVTHTGLGGALAEWLLQVVAFEPGDGPRNFAAMWGIGLGVGLVTTLPAQPGIMTPLAESIAQATGWPLESVLLMQVPSWIVFALPYQAPPIYMTLLIGKIGVGDAMKVMGPFFLFGLIVILPLQYLWGSWLGFYP